MFQALAGLLAFFYELVPSYGLAITLLTLTVMLVLTPLTWKSTRSMLEMQRLQPEIKKLQQKHKNDRQKLNEELMAFYKEHKVNPLGGCLPMLLQLPVFLVMYRVIHGLTQTRGGAPSPAYLEHDSKLYTALVEDGGKMVSWGIDLSKSASKTWTEFGLAEALPLLGVVALVVVAQYVQTKQMSGRSSASQQNPQMMMMQRIMPLMFGFISYSIAAGVNIYFLVSSLFRITQQELMYRFDPVLVAHVKQQAKEIEVHAYEKDKNKGKKDGSARSKAPKDKVAKATTDKGAKAESGGNGASNDKRAPKTGAAAQKRRTKKAR
ncbi:MAG: YidC/Oxa1 family membrane protein insertase [Actinomycetota bacterium]|nr:YidC/Oxa1 family membrane protein insertase [Actinomycetota bacterium]